MTEITDFASIVLVVTVGFALAVLATTLTERVPVPAPAIFLLAAAAVSDIWPGVYDAVEIETVERIAVVALVVILFNGGLRIGWRRFRASAAPILSIGLLGTFATAGLVTLLAHYVLGFEWVLAGVVGAAVAPTDPAVMFSVLGRREVAGRSGTILEGEAGVNDPVGIALMLGMVELATHDDASFWVVVEEFAVEMSIGVAFGLLGALALLPLLRRLRLPSEGLYPVLALVLAGAFYGATSSPTGRASSRSSSPPCSWATRGSVQGRDRALLGLAGEPCRAGRLRRARTDHRHRRALGSHLAGGHRPRAGTRPPRSASCRAPDTRPRPAELGRARVRHLERPEGGSADPARRVCPPRGVTGAERVYGVVFVVVLFSVLGQGTLVPFVAKLSTLDAGADRAPVGTVRSIRRGTAARDELEVGSGSRAAGRFIRDLPLGEHVWITLVVRDIGRDPSRRIAPAASG